MGLCLSELICVRKYDNNFQGLQGKSEFTDTHRHTHTRNHTTQRHTIHALEVCQVDIMSQLPGNDQTCRRAKFSQKVLTTLINAINEVAEGGDFCLELMASRLPLRAFTVNYFWMAPSKADAS